MVTHLLDELVSPLHLRVALWKVTKMEVCMGRTQGTQIQKGLVHILLSYMEAFMAS